MQEAASHKTTSHKTPLKAGAAFTANHGVNPGWGVYEERPVIPEFGNVAEIGKLALMFTLWSRIEDFIYKDVGIKPLDASKEEKKHRAVLLESETYLIALLCLLNNEHYSASGLVDAMVGVDATADQRGNARKRILNRTLPIVGDRYGLIDYSERHMGNSMEYSICRSTRLVEFAETHLVSGFGSIVGEISGAGTKTRATAKKSTKSRKSQSNKATKTQTNTRAAKTSAAKARAVKSGESQ